MSEYTVRITNDNFEKEVIASEVPVMLDFWAEWCPSCKALMPTVDEVAEEYTGKIKIGKVDTDEATDLSEQFRIMSIPTLLFFKGGELVDMHIGTITKTALKAQLDGMLK